MSEVERLCPNATIHCMYSRSRKVREGRVKASSRCRRRREEEEQRDLGEGVD